MIPQLRPSFFFAKKVMDEKAVETLREFAEL